NFSCRCKRHCITLPTDQGVAKMWRLQHDRSRDRPGFDRKIIETVIAAKRTRLSRPANSKYEFRIVIDVRVPNKTDRDETERSRLLIRALRAIERVGRNAVDGHAVCFPRLSAIDTICEYLVMLPACCTR